VAWTLALVSLAALWVRSPFLGTGTSFAVWSVPTALLAVTSWRWFRARRIEQIPAHPALAIAVGVAWTLALALAASDLGDRLTLDGLIMRQPTVRAAGRVLAWAPLAFGSTLCIAGLAASLEARYRLVNDPRTLATPPDPGR
jgi:hypothetical protein